MSIPKRAAQVFSVSGPVDAATRTIIEALAKRRFRVRSSSSGVTTLQFGYRSLPLLFGQFALLPGPLGYLGKFMRLVVEQRAEGRILVGVEEMRLGITLYPVILEALEETVSVLEANGTLSDVGPIADLDDLRSIHPA